MAARGKREEREEREGEGAAAADETTPQKARGEAKESAVRPLEDSLDEFVPGIEILDRDLVFEGGARADLAGVDPSGRLHLVVVAGEDPDRTVLDALDAVSLLRSDLELLVQHLGAERVNRERAPRVLVVSPDRSERLAARLSALEDAGVTVLGLSTVKSASGERSYLVRLGARGQERGIGGGVEAFRRALPPRLAELGSSLIERMARLDEELEPSADATTIVWRLQGELLCRVERIGELLQASVAPGHETLPLSDGKDLERLVEKALERLVRLLGWTRKEPPGGEERRGENRSEPLLTPEEIEAFRD